MTDQLTSVIAEYPIPRPTPFTPPSIYGDWRADGPAREVTLPEGRRCWVVTRHADVRAALTDRRFSSDRRNAAFREFRGEDVDHENAPVTAHMLGMDAPEHSVARKAVIGEFTLRRMNALRPRIQQIVDASLDNMLAGQKPADLVQAFALPVPSLVICELLGVPYADHDFFQERSTELMLTTNSQQQRSKAANDLNLYLSELIATKEAAAEPSDDLLGRYIARQRAEHGEVDHQTMVALAFILLVAGHETTANMISLGTLAFLRNPDQLAAIVDDPDRTLLAIEELLRVFSIAESAVIRGTLEDVEIGGVTIPADNPVLVLINAANHDPSAFPEPDLIDVTRGARNHVAFGYGIHQCIGQNLARLELQIAFDTLFRRIPQLRLAVPTEELRFKDDGVVFGAYELPVTW